jgi:hypothetical protein
MIYHGSPSDVSPHTVITQRVKLPEYHATTQNSQFHENALTTVLNENTNVGHFRTAGSFMILVKLPALQSVRFDSFGESGLGRVRLLNDGGFFPLVFLLCEFYNLRMSQAAEGIGFKIFIFEIYNYRVL